MKKLWITAAAGAALGLLGACGTGGSAGSGASVSLNLKLAGALTATALQGFAPFDTVGDHASFTPTGMKLPIMKITMSGSDGSNAQTLYACENANEADCLVDLASQTELDAIVAKVGQVSVSAGEYALLSLYTCADGKGGSEKTTAYVKGSASFGGVTWTTSPANASGVDDTGSGTAGETAIANWGCSTKNVIMSPAVTIAEGDEAKLTILVDNAFGASFGTLISSGRGGCKASGHSVCAEYPALLPYVGSGTATTKRFKIAHHISSAGSIVDDKANALIIVAMADSTPIMAYGRILYTSTSALISGNTAALDSTYGGPNYITETDYKSFTLNADGSIAFSQGGSADTYAAQFSAFKISDHTGDVKTRDGTVTWKYHAIPLD